MLRKLIKAAGWLYLLKRSEDRGVTATVARAAIAEKLSREA